MSPSIDTNTTSYSAFSFGEPIESLEASWYLSPEDSCWSESFLWSGEKLKPAGHSFSKALTSQQRSGAVWVRVFATQLSHSEMTALQVWYASSSYIKLWLNLVSLHSDMNWERSPHQSVEVWHHPCRMGPSSKLCNPLAHTCSQPIPWSSCSCRSWRSQMSKTTDRLRGLERNLALQNNLALRCPHSQKL